MHNAPALVSSCSFDSYILMKATKSPEEFMCTWIIPIAAPSGVIVEEIKPGYYLECLLVQKNTRHTLFISTH